MKFGVISTSFVMFALAMPCWAEDRSLFTLDAQNSASAWRNVNDGVMGGRSTGRFRINADQHMEFYGSLSLANNGGFASVRARTGSLELRPDDLIVARVRGDGREYKFNVYDRGDLSGYSYRQSFVTKKDEWMEVKLPVREFVATWRGRVFPNQKLDARKIAGVGFLIGDKRPGPFKLEIAWVKAVSGDEK